MNAQTAIAYLRQSQAKNGSFDGFASPTVEPFVGTRKQPTIFPTILMLDCLKGVLGTEDIRRKATRYIQSQVNEQGAWNYWDIHSAAKNAEPYLDDLDDTACALAAIMRNDPAWVDGRRLGQFTRLLVATENQPGGPYNTWLIDTTQAPQWKHTDIAVNANIGYALSLQSVRLSALMQYIDESIKNGSIESDYYVGKAPVLYFLSRWYKGDQLAMLQKLVVHEKASNALQQALLLSAACKLGVAQHKLATLAHALEASLQDDHWPAAGFYIDPVYNGQQHVGGSEVLTTAFALEALTNYAQSVTPEPLAKASVTPKNVHLTAIRQDASTINDAGLRRRYMVAVNQVIRNQNADHIVGAASLVAKSTGWLAPSNMLRQLDVASINGWVAYTLYDDFLDGADMPVSQLNVANLAMRRSYSRFVHALPGNAEFAALTQQAFDTIDGANDWEQRHARAPVVGGLLRLKRLPNYGDYAQLAERSWGHSLAACGVASVHFGSLQDSNVLALQRFFKHFLIARQLHDDAHDWEADLRAGQLSAVVTLLLKDARTLPCSIHIIDALDDLRQHFWRTTIHEVSALIRAQLEAARHELDTITAPHGVHIFASWLDTLEAGVDQAMQGQQEAVEFIQAYEGSHV